jgi:SAM-dependent methyltransferase
MKRWMIKGLIQGTLSRAPGGVAFNDLLQRTLGGRRDLVAHVNAKIHADWIVHMRNIRRLRLDIEDREIVEIGTGWLPVLPMCFALVGVRRCHSFDLNRHLSPGSLTRVLGMIEPHLDAIAQAAELDPRIVRRRWTDLSAQRSVDALLARSGLSYHAPADATRTGLPDASVALVISNSVLEHVPASVLGALMRESVRVLAPDGLSLHSVNCGDHYAYFDRSITPINYLTFDERSWKRWNNDILYQNRLRPSDFLAAADEAGLEIVLDTHKPRQDLLDALPRLAIASEFGRYGPSDLCCTSIDFAGRPARNAQGTSTGTTR